jgi:hypothetical protein
MHAEIFDKQLTILNNLIPTVIALLQFINYPTIPLIMN